MEDWYGSVTFDTMLQSSTLQMMQHLSSAWDARNFPIGSHATPFTNELCPFRVFTLCPVTGSQTITKLSSEHDASIESSGAHAMSITSETWPFRFFTLTQFSTLGSSLLPNAARPGPERFSYRNTCVSVDPDARNRPFRLNRTQFTVLKWSESVARIFGTFGSPSTSRLFTALRFQTLTFWSPPAVAMREPSG